ncbi:MAG: BREX system P-loop protein BrxC [Spirosomaceae bacterium]|jgi:hypothetical protein|nr:BREX system P-loop protein BrxC [Spirosomataceae bacterium]
MKIEHLYDKEIDRRINPAVVVSEMEDYYINQEIDEYVFTTGVTKNIYKFLHAITQKKEGKTGVWISGYYGSGKSHFIKYLFYCLSRRYHAKAFGNFKESVKQLDPLEEPNLQLVTQIERSLEKLTIDNIIFNIDAVADTRTSEKERITRVLLNQLNDFRGYNSSNVALALYLEKPLDKAGVFERFKERIFTEFNEKWQGNQVRFVRMYLSKVLEIAKEFDNDIDTESLKISIQDKNQDYNIDFLTNELSEYLQTQSSDYRLIFLMDEVSQYIGSNTSTLLNLQTIIEEIGSKIGQRVWVVCTAQQDLSRLISNTDSKTEDFGKILGRFETMISLESQDAAFITKKRILDKKSEGIEILNQYYKTNKGAVDNQFVFDHDLYKNYAGKDDFILTYPFVPYQFRLISDVFESFSNVGYVGEGVKNTERAILGITHYTARLCKEQSVGYFVPFDLFFNQELEKNLTHHARGILDRAYQIDQIKTDTFAQRVVKALFMISNLGDSQKVNFPANIENLALLLMESADSTKLDMQHKVQQVLSALVLKNIIQESEGKYRFLKEDEIEVAHLIKTTPTTVDDKLSYFYDDIIQKRLKPSPTLSLAGFNRAFRPTYAVDDKEYGAKGDFNIKFVVFDSTELDRLAHNVPANDLIICIGDWLKNDKELLTKFQDYVRTQVFIKNNKANATGTRNETIAGFRETNLVLLNEIYLRFEKSFLQTAIISNNRIVGANDLNGLSASARLDDMIKKHTEELYRKHKLSAGYATTNAELIANAKTGTQTSTVGLELAEEELNNKLNIMGDGPIVGDVVKQFEKPPYGWKDIATLDILLKIAKKGIRRFEWRNEEVDLVTYADKALNSRERDALTVHTEKTHSPEETNAFIHAVNHEIFNENLISAGADFKTAVESFKKNLEPMARKVNNYKTDYEGYPFGVALKTYHQLLSEIQQSRNPESVVAFVMAQKKQLRSARDTFMMVDEFVINNFETYQQIAEYFRQNKNNFVALDETLLPKADLLQNYFAHDHEPWDRFPQIRKAYRELHEALQKRVNDLKADVIGTYEAVFEAIEARRKELSISEPNLTPDAANFLQKISKESQIAQLELQALRANDFRAENLKILEEFKAKQLAKQSGNEYIKSVDVSVASEMKPTLIETPEQLDTYLATLKQRLLAKLAKNKKIFLN